MLEWSEDMSWNKVVFLPHEMIKKAKEVKIKLLEIFIETALYNDKKINAEREEHGFNIFSIAEKRQGFCCTHKK